MDPIWDSLPENCTLKRCGRDGVKALAKRWHEVTYPPRAPIVSAEDGGADVYFILSGKARAATYSANGREVAFSDLKPGASFGEIAALDGGPRSTNVFALTEARVARLPSAAFHELIDTDRAVMRAILGYLAARVRPLSNRMLAMTTMNARERLIAELLALAEPSEDDSAVIPELPTQQDLANAILGQREAVGREMSRLREAGLVSRSGRRLTIHSVTDLQSLLIRD